MALPPGIFITKEKNPTHENIMNTFSHLDAKGLATMVNISDKEVSLRSAVARSVVELPLEVMAKLAEGDIQTKKGSVVQTAIIAGIMAAKKTGELIPLCHSLGLENCAIEIHIEEDNLVIDCTAMITSKTGVEMEALVGASVAALTVYDMCKALSHDIVIKETRLIEKTGGKNDYKRP
jgi:cyclic pyranopterin monophosphate synthase